jgi:HAD superfamily 5'-nucleotidase-like hydrolase
MPLTETPDAPAAGEAPEQLGLPLPDLIQRPSGSLALPRAGRVFVNRNLEMSSIRWVGFDMDYTLAIYHQRAMDTLSVEQTVRRLIQKGYPEYLNGLHYDTRFPIRGLLIDKRYGHVLKMDRHKVVHRGYHGMRRLSRSELEELYQHKKIRPHTARYHWIDTLFALSEVTAYAAIVAAMEERGERVHYERLFTDVRVAIDEAHADGEVHRRILEKPGEYIAFDPQLAKTLHKLRSAGKRLFLLTNSPFHYTEGVMTHLLGKAMHEYPTWQHYFDFAVCAARKPDWFKASTPLSHRSNGELKPSKPTLDRHQVYEGGSLKDLERYLGVPGSSVLYVGDHIYGDILRSKKESAWRTAMIIPELEAEIGANEELAGHLKRDGELSLAMQQLEDELRFYQTRYKEVSKDKESDPTLRHRLKQQLERVRTELLAVEREQNNVSAAVDLRFHPYWGSLLKEHQEMSSFGLQVELYADIYMRQVSSLAGYSPMQLFRSPRDLMPHEL